MIKVVLDTNIIVSANLKAQGIEALVVRLAASGKIQMCVSPPILAEYESVLRRPKFKFTLDLIEGVLQLIRETAVLFTDLPTIKALADEKDNCFLECADAASAHFLVTGNTRHFPTALQDHAASYCPPALGDRRA
ncbi:MAG: putative toxin-antitoxin system toxin component, PIN family [Bryobacterales bacterium]|nr:putative toxin-antitoxin system toxin component, PIN family [Bryobacterales bacterium]